MKRQSFITAEASLSSLSFWVCNTRPSSPRECYSFCQHPQHHSSSSRLISIFLIIFLSRRHRYNTLCYIHAVCQRAVGLLASVQRDESFILFLILVWLARKLSFHHHDHYCQSCESVLRSISSKHPKNPMILILFYTYRGFFDLPLFILFREIVLSCHQAWIMCCKTYYWYVIIIVIHFTLFFTIIANDTPFFQYDRYLNQHKVNGMYNSKVINVTATSPWLFRNVASQGLPLT